MTTPGIYRYEKYSMKVVTLLFAFVTLAFLVNGEYIGGSITLVLAVLSAFSYQGTIIDPIEKRYIRYDRFLNFRIGGWKTLPPPSYVTIVRINLSSRRTAASPVIGPQDLKSARSFKVNLVVEGKMRFVPICRGSLDKTTEEALRLGRDLQIRVLDLTTHEKIWIL